MLYALQILKGVALGVLMLVSAYVFRFGKSDTGIKTDYVFTALFVIFVIYRL